MLYHLQDKILYGGLTFSAIWLLQSLLGVATAASRALSARSPWLRMAVTASSALKLLALSALLLLFHSGVRDAFAKRRALLRTSTRKLLSPGGGKGQQSAAIEDEHIAAAHSRAVSRSNLLLGSSSAGSRSKMEDEPTELPEEGVEMTSTTSEEALDTRPISV